jgi:hypothetical protein
MRVATHLPSPLLAQQNTLNSRPFLRKKGGWGFPAVFCPFFQAIIGVFAKISTIPPPKPKTPPKSGNKPAEMGRRQRAVFYFNPVSIIIRV